MKMVLRSSAGGSSAAALLLAAVGAACWLPPRCLAATAAAAGSEAASSSPAQKVLSMMAELKAKGEKMMDEEKKTFNAYADWVGDESKRLGFEIEDGASKIDELIAVISKAEQDAVDLGREVASLDQEINSLEAERAEATQLRGEQRAAYLKVSQDYGESVDALRRAIDALEAQDFDRPAAEALLQQMSEAVPGMPRAYAALLQQEEAARRGSVGLRGDSAPAAYEAQSGGLVPLLDGLLDKFKRELADAEEAEANQAHAYSLVTLHIKDTLARDTSDKSGKAALRGKKLAASAKAKGELAETRKAKADDEKLKSEIEATFKAKMETFQANQKVRAEELEAIAKAAEIISSPEVSGSYSKHINLQQVKATALTKTVSFLQMGRSAMRMAVRQQAASLLTSRAKVLGGSKALTTLASALTADGPFAKVVDMIETLINNLKEQAAAEVEHKAWCDEQLKANKLKREKQTATANELSADIEGLTASIEELSKTISKLSDEQTELTDAMTEATKLRQAEHAQNAAAIADAAAASEAVKQALVVLKEFYSGQAALLQEQRQAPEMAEYKGMQSSKGGIIGMLEVIQTDFMRLGAQTRAAEKAAAAEYKTFMEESGAAKEQKHQMEVKLKLGRDAAEFDRKEAGKDLKATRAELGEASQYYEELKPNCVEAQVSFEERRARRLEEIDALKEAYATLDGGR